MQNLSQSSGTATFASGKNSRKQSSRTLSKPLEHILAENSIKENNLQYQQLLIKSKQLEIMLGEIQVEHGRLVKQRRKAEKLADDTTQKKQLALMQLKEKQFYLQRYYEELDKKFRGGRQDLFAGLTKLESNLLEMYQRDQKRIKQSLQPQRDEIQRMSASLRSQLQHRDMLRQQLYGLERVKQANNIGYLSTEKQQLLAENQMLKGEMQRLVREKKTLQSDEKILKKILCVEQDHKKHGAIIAAGIRKMFSIRVKEQRYKEAVSLDYEKNLEWMRNVIVKRNSDRQKLIDELQQKKIKLLNLKQQNQLKHKQYSELEDELFRRQSR